MKTKFSLTTIFFQVMIFGSSLFVILTQFGLLRQPTKLIIQMICLLSLLSLAIAIWNYVREEKD
ncbi:MULTISPECIES: hypothetical protein [Streptococcus]|jgi:hypothetical protein|uniref:Uncharacterized protein n=1 Tax=Streptococcus mitis TaxID=28037 RepID=A0A1X1JL81_STRMT|nr:MULTISPECIES: hypothetical protein [Streptococcus]MDU6722096.1 hypothetical protein [Streptococcus mitis]MQQ32355.1 hypothetical protein [Streptococcus mitis]MQQ50507.1 hypothetical protein [Streptococcus mitis]ORO87902.1 hypothetical protein B7701_09630 [Streptococcus mitis]ORP03540.1 hypothetical protein B7695_04220 [Streptococcus mitis]